MAFSSSFPKVSNNFEPPHPRSSTTPLVSKSVVIDKAPLQSPKVNDLGRFIFPDSAARKTVDTNTSSNIGVHNEPLPHKARVSFAKVVQKSSSKPADVLAQDFCALQPVNVGNKSVFIIPKALYQRRLKVVPLGKRLFSIIFSSPEELSVAQAKSTWKMNPGIMRIRDWTPNFDPYKEASSLSQVWLRIYYLSHDYWDPEVIADIACQVGMPIKLDGQTFVGVVGHFAHVLVDLEVSKAFPETLTVQRGSSSFEVEFDYENLPYFCGFCKIAGHSIDQCLKFKTHKVNNPSQINNDIPKVDARQTNLLAAKDIPAHKQVGVWRRAENVIENTNNSFAALQNFSEEPRVLIQDNTEETTIYGTTSHNSPERHSNTVPGD
ncbi:uncharacterized protein LOC131018933 [Salvia miltiorrhiza]|uniref:uncharacterized protein LOC131018933 n=1 Tax=Salvia miltiorrhiza TaxID=226208 RepID=UPI0025AD0749|nr:uncharacterized protein LOC131018933 [Salvia miltiorrhiza]